MSAKMQAVKSNLLEKLCSKHTTSLSNYVKDLFDTASLKSEMFEFDGNLKHSINSNFVEYFEMEHHICCHITGLSDQGKIVDYKLAVTALSDLFQLVTRHLAAVDPETFVHRNKVFMQWLCVDTNQLIHCLQGGQSSCRAIRYCACLQLVAILERSLQNLHWSIDGKTPVILKDLLRSSTLHTFLSPSIVLWLDILVGSPKSLNIRNLLWHGFGSAAENPENFVFVIFFTLLVISRFVHSHSLQIASRPFHVLQELKIISSHTQLTSSYQPEEFFKIMKTVQVKSAEIFQAVQFAQAKHYGLACMLLLTSFEHIMRIAFCVFNECPSRIMTAVNSEYFTTLDVVFEESFGDIHKPNRLYEALPARLRTALNDLLYYPHGLRLRDKLSHMEIYHKSVTKEVWLYTFNIISATVYHFLSDSPSNYEPLNHISNDYVPSHHPISELVEELQTLEVQTGHVMEIETDIELVSEVAGRSNLLVSCDKLLEYFSATKGTRHPSLVNLLFADVSTAASPRSLAVSSVFRPLSEWCKWLHSICHNMVKTTDQIICFHKSWNEMYQRKTLRSRQRKNFDMFHSIKAALISILETFTIMIKHSVDMMASSSFQCIVAKSHKGVLKLSENLLKLVEDHKWLKVIEHFERTILLDYS